MLRAYNKGRLPALIPNVRLALKIRARKIHSSFFGIVSMKSVSPSEDFKASSTKWINLIRLPEKLKWTNTLAYLSTYNKRLVDMTRSGI
jgi:hypothetical protein